MLKLSQDDKNIVKYRKGNTCFKVIFAQFTELLISLKKMVGSNLKTEKQKKFSDLLGLLKIFILKEYI